MKKPQIYKEAWGVFEKRGKAWKSSDNPREVHYFVDLEENGVTERNVYIIGFNPEMVSQKTIRKILRIIKESL